MRTFPEWTKLPRGARDELSSSEDYLTAHTFGLLRFCTAPTLALLLDTLGVGRPADADIDIELWPLIPHEPRELSDEVGMNNCEPDVVIRASSFVCFVEVKFVGSRIGRYASQLGREWLLARNAADESAWKGPCLLLVTKDGAEPLVPSWSASGEQVSVSMQIAEFLADMALRGLPIQAGTDEEIAPLVKWVSWAEISRAVELVHTKVTGVDARVFREIAGVLEVFGCSRFAGWSAQALDPIPAPPPAGELLLGFGEWSPFKYPLLPIIPKCPDEAFLPVGETGTNLFMFHTQRALAEPPAGKLFGGL